MKTQAAKKNIPKSDIKILVVDDREDNLFSIEAILERDNYSIIKANSGRAALKVLLQEHDFSLILMDVQMPDLNGFETATMIYERDRLRSIPIIFITAHDYDEDYIFKGYSMGAVDYIYKPINPDLLRVKVGVFVELYRKNQQLVTHEKKLLEANEALQNEIEERKISEEKVKTLNEQLLANNAHLKAINEELDQFAYVASHDLQEPLRKIMVFSDKILLKNNIDDETGKYFNKITSSAKRMQSLINDLLSFSRHTNSSNDFKFTDLNQLVKEAVGELEIEIEKSNAQVIYSDLPSLWAIPSLMQQLFYNLVSNGIKFRKKDVAPVVTISTERINNSDNTGEESYLNGQPYYRITVTDNGIGFDEKYADEIFVVFKRLHSYHEFEGTGVGLSLCKKIVEKHDGIITASSKLQEGSSFVIDLPDKQPVAPETSVKFSLPHRTQ